MSWYRFPIGVLSTAVWIACDPGGGTSCGEGERNVGGKCAAVLDSEVHLNSIGFLPGHTKQATFVGGSGAFEIVDEQDRIVFEGIASDPVNSSETGEQGLRVADFTAFDEEGVYQLRAVDAGESPKFRIGRDVMTEVVRVLMLGLYGQRCGEAVSIDYGGTKFEHGACHAEDAWLDAYGDASARQPALYGWHDAGDYGKYVNNGALSLGNMLFAWQQYPALAALEFGLPDAKGLPHFLAECRFQLDWLLGMQREDGSVADRVTTRGFDAMVSPDASLGRRFLAPVTSTATADFAAVVARAARAFEGEAPELASVYREKALAAWQFLEEHQEPISVSQAERSAFTGAYWSGDADDRLWAAAEIWELTGDAEALAFFEQKAATVMVENYWDWQNLANFGTFTYLLSKREGRKPELVKQLTDALGAGVASLRDTADKHPYGRPAGVQYYWGINGVVARMALNIGVYDALVPDPRNRDLLVKVVDHLLGRNYYGRSYVTGIGHDPPYYPHHRPSVADGNPEPWPGLLVGGPWADTGNAATAWVDSANDYRTNEVAINWNAAMIYAAAALME
jgi:endoglucanase